MANARRTSRMNAVTWPEPPPEDGAGDAAQPPRVAFIGEMNAGKTTLVNLLLQDRLLATGIMSGTPCPILLRYGNPGHLRIHQADGSVAVGPLLDLHRPLGPEAVRVEAFVPNPVLRGMEILDLPGWTTAAQAEPHAELIAASDIQIWCSSVTQAWKASERALWLSLARPRTGAFLVLTHRDLVSPRQLEDVEARVARETQGFFAQRTSIAAADPLAAPAGTDGWTVAGAGDFIAKLQDLLQQASVPDARPSPPPLASAAPASAAPATVARASTPPASAAHGGPPASASVTAADAAKPIVAAPPRAPLAAIAATASGGVPQVPSPQTGAPASLPDPLSSFREVRQRIVGETGDARGALAANLIARELDGFSRHILQPWLESRGASLHSGQRLRRMIVAGEDGLVACFTPQTDDPGPFTPVNILRQIELELAEALRATCV